MVTEFPVIVYNIIESPVIVFRMLLVCFSIQACRIFACLKMLVDAVIITVIETVS